MKRGGSLSFLVGTISNVLVMEIGWTDVGSGGYILVSTSCHYITIESISIGKKVKVDNAIVKVRYYLAAPFDIG